MPLSIMRRDEKSGESVTERPKDGTETVCADSSDGAVEDRTGNISDPISDVSHS